MWDSSVFLGALTPKFYVALTGTSSLISGLILIFEWWYFRKYGTSFIEQVSVGQLAPWLGGGGAGGAGGAGAGGADAAPADGGAGDDDDDDECKVWRNPMSLLRGAEYARLWTARGRAPLTYYDMNLSAQEHQAWFGAAGDGPAEEALARAWREREPRARVAAAREALRHEPRAAAALLLLAEEDAPTVAEAERVLRTAWRAAEAALRAGGGARDAAVLAHVKRRTAMCLRRLGRLRDAARLFRELAREPPPALRALAPHENLLEVLLERRRYADAGAAAARAGRSACALYTAALVRARAAAAEAPAALRRAIAYNPHVPAYLLELRALAPPPEHVLRRGRSEALAYAFFHLRHWRHADPALRMLAAAWQAWGAAELAAAGLRSRCAARADRELVAGAAGGAVWGAGAGAEAGAGTSTAVRRAPALLPLGAALCAGAALAALLAHRWPQHAHSALTQLRRAASPEAPDGDD